ncbi:MAG: TraB/GumN family protein, partial [Flavobacterium sp.]
MKKVTCMLIALCFGTLLHGQNLPKTILWKVTKPESNNVSYLFGTFHEVNPSFFDLLTNVVAKLKQSDVLFVEQRFSVPNKPTSKKQSSWSTIKWNKILTADQKKIFAEFVSKAEDTSYYNLPPLHLSHATFRLYSTGFCQSDNPTSKLMDPHIEKIAEKERKQIYSLDLNQGTIMDNEAEKFSSSQDSLYASYSTRYMENMLTTNLSDCELLNTYKKFDLNYEFDTDLSKNPASFLLLDRNTKWIKILQQPLSKSNCFIAVGFRHLFYKQGLIEQLRNLGYTVTP